MEVSVVRPCVRADIGGNGEGDERERLSYSPQMSYD